MLEQFKSTGVRLFPSTLESLGKGCKKLKHLALQRCNGLDDSGVLNDSGVIALVQNCHGNVSSKSRTWFQLIYINLLRLCWNSF
jgi:hypothetical protein